MSEAKKEYIVVGAGVGGLFCAATLAHFGHKVKVIESHYNVGGYASSFKRKKARHEVAIHMIANMREKSFRKLWFEKLGITNNIVFTPINEFYDVYVSGQYYKVPGKLDEYIAFLIEIFPKEEIGLLKYKEDITSIIGELDAFLHLGSAFGYLRSPVMSKVETITLKNYLESLFTDQTLIEIITANLDFIHDDISTVRAASFMFLEATYLSTGQCFIQGSSQSVGDYLRKYIEDRGGDFLMGHLVQGLECGNDSIQAVKALKRSTGEIKTITGDEFIFNNSPITVSNWLTEKEIPAQTQRKISPSSCSIYLEFSKPPKEFGVKAYMSMFCLSGHESAKIEGIKKLGFVDYAALDSKLSEESYLGAFLYLDDYANWSNLSKAEYDQRKEDHLTVIKAVIEERFPGLMNHCVRIDFATPLTMERYTQNPDGAIYGYSNALGVSSMQKRSYNFDGVKNLSMASAWVVGPGFDLCSCVGIQTALDLLDIEYYDGQE